MFQLQQKTICFRKIENKALFLLYDSCNYPVGIRIIIRFGSSFLYLVRSFAGSVIADYSSLYDQTVKRAGTAFVEIEPTPRFERNSGIPERFPNRGVGFCHFFSAALLSLSMRETYTASAPMNRAELNQNTRSASMPLKTSVFTAVMACITIMSRIKMVAVFNRSLRSCFHYRHAGDKFKLLLPTGCREQRLCQPISIARKMTREYRPSSWDNV